MGHRGLYKPESNVKNKKETLQSEVICLFACLLISANIEFSEVSIVLILST